MNVSNASPCIYSFPLAAEVNAELALERMIPLIAAALNGLKLNHFRLSIACASDHPAGPSNDSMQIL